MKLVGIMAVLLTLAACDAAEDSVNKAGSGLKQNYDTTRKHLSKWIYRWNGDEADAPPPKVIANSYCYQVQMDILCYEEPRMDLGSRLVAYQGSTAYPPGYMPPAPPVMMAPEPIASRDLPPPFAPASDETMAKVHAANSAAYTPPPPGAPKGLMGGK